MFTSGFHINYFIICITFYKHINTGFDLNLSFPLPWIVCSIKQTKNRIRNYTHIEFELFTCTNSSTSTWFSDVLYWALKGNNKISFNRIYYKIKLMLNAYETKIREQHYSHWVVNEKLYSKNLIKLKFYYHLFNHFMQ